MRRTLPLLLLAFLGAAACSDEPSSSPRSTNDTTDTASDTAEPDADHRDDADTNEDVAPDLPPDPGCLTQIYQPDRRDDIDLWPDALYQVPDPNRPTGFHLSIDGLGFTNGLAAAFAPVSRALELSSGFGTNGAIYARFTQALTGFPATAEASLTDPVYIVLDLDAAPPARVPFETSTIEDGQTVVLKPVRPLAAGHRHAMIITTDARPLDATCVETAEMTRAILSGEAASPFNALQDDWLEAIDAVGLAPADVLAVTTFTVQHDLVTFASVAQAIDDTEGSWTVREPCVEDAGRWRRCELAFEPLDVRSPDGPVLSATATGSHVVPVTAWLPLDTSRPAIPIVFGHGANTDRTLAEEVAELLVGEGFALIAADAIEHGDHPIKGAGGGNDFLRFLGLSLAPVEINPSTMGGNFNQSVLEWVQLAQLVKTRPDFDGDGVDELNSERVAYFGISLGALLGSGVSALSNDLDATLLSMGGGWLLIFLREIELLKDSIGLLAPLVGGPGRLDRFFVIAQSAVDAADPASWGPFILRRRVLGDSPPHLLFPVTVNDEIVPFSAGRALANAIDAPIEAQVFRPVPLLEPAPAPLSANLDGRTAAYMQFDLVTNEEGQPLHARHQEFPRSREHEALILHWFTTWRDLGTPEIIRPQ